MKRFLICLVVLVSSAIASEAQAGCRRHPVVGAGKVAVKVATAPVRLPVRFVVNHPGPVRHFLFR